MGRISFQGENIAKNAPSFCTALTIGDNSSEFHPIIIFFEYRVKKRRNIHPQIPK